MNESTEQRAPQLSTATDANVGDEQLTRIEAGAEDMPTSGGETSSADKTMDTPDQLGGTGGEQAGGAG